MTAQVLFLMFFSEKDPHLNVIESEFYAKHPSFVKVMNSHSGVFDNIDTLLAVKSKCS